MVLTSNCMTGLWLLGSTGRNTGPRPKVSSFFSACNRSPSHRQPRLRRNEDQNPTRAVLFAGAGERRQRTVELPFALPPVAPRNGLAPPLRIGAPANVRNHQILTSITHKFCYRPIDLEPNGTQPQPDFTPGNTNGCTASNRGCLARNCSSTLPGDRSRTSKWRRYHDHDSVMRAHRLLLSVPGSGRCQASSVPRKPRDCASATAKWRIAVPVALR